MTITEEQKRRLCALAAACVAQREAEFRPEGIAPGEVTNGTVIAQHWRGSVGAISICAVTIQWRFTHGPGIDAMTQSVHVRQHCYQDQAGHWRVRLLECHFPLWEIWPWCSYCGTGFTEEQPMLIKSTR